MKTFLEKTKEKKLQLKKTSIAHLALNDKQMELLHGGNYQTLPTQSARPQKEANPCTSVASFPQ